MWCLGGNLPVRSGLSLVRHIRRNAVLPSSRSAEALEGLGLNSSHLPSERRVTLHKCCAASRGYCGDLPQGPPMRKKDDSGRSPTRGAGNAGPVHVGMTLQQAEKLLIAATVQSTDGNMSRAATILGIDRSTLYEKMKLYGFVRWTRERRKSFRELPEEV